MEEIFSSTSRGFYDKSGMRIMDLDQSQPHLVEFYLMVSRALGGEGGP